MLWITSPGDVSLRRMALPGQAEPPRPVTCLLIGDRGDGKSTFGNCYLGNAAFVTKNSCDPVTCQPQHGSAVVDGVTRYVIDTEGFDSGATVSQTQIQRLATFLREWPHGINGIFIVMNGTRCRWSGAADPTYSITLVSCSLEPVERIWWK